eukprot:CAMPEP_0168521014 /NCGR_PEP_ID=MMETSP0405-20121227/8399_1 /TAXON_ID=498012 /ORGANISM="Trichosphaerium sp, Strain Am-I-7 wt" /LENGTH=223 /DNA_ID=CAMNT_0008542143 /DNA_START=181 /DNA_END=852 /DNA_ORIENTATION=-
MTLRKVRKKGVKEFCITTVHRGLYVRTKPDAANMWIHHITEALKSARNMKTETRTTRSHSASISSSVRTPTTLPGTRASKALSLKHTSKKLGLGTGHMLGKESKSFGDKITKTIKPSSFTLESSGESDTENSGDYKAYLSTAIEKGDLDTIYSALDDDKSIGDNILSVNNNQDKNELVSGYHLSFLAADGEEIALIPGESIVTASMRPLPFEPPEDRPLPEVV